MNVERWRRTIRLACSYPLLARLPRALAYRGATVLGSKDARLRADLRTALRNGFEQAYPELRDCPATLRRWTALHARMRAREVMDTFWLPRLERRTMAAMVDVQGLDQLQAAIAERQGVILVMAHYSRLIMLLAALGALGVRMSMLTMRIDESNPELVPAERRYLRAKVEALLAYIGGNWLSLGQSLRPLYAGLSRGEVWIVLLDAYTPEFGQWASYPFLGGQLSISRGIERILAKTGARAVYASVRERSATELEGRLLRLPSDPAAVPGRAVAELEADVVQAPWQWWQWNILDYIWTPQEASRQT